MKSRVGRVRHSSTDGELLQFKPVLFFTLRFSFKLLFDQASLGPMESADELFSTLEEYERDWYIGLVTEKGWHDSVLQEKPFLFSLGHDLAMVISTQHKGLTKHS